MSSSFDSNGLIHKANCMLHPKPKKMQHKEEEEEQQQQVARP
jgi:hypothetical protein